MRTFRGLQIHQDNLEWMVIIMCMKYLNANIICYDDVESDGLDPICFKKPFDRITALVQKDIALIGDFTIVLHINIIGTDNEKEQKNNVLYTNDKLNFKIRLTKCDPNPQNQLAVDLKQFDLDVKKLHKDLACYPFLNYTHVIDVKEIPLEQGVGKYALKVLVKNSNEDETKYTVQSMRNLEVIEKHD